MIPRARTHARPFLDSPLTVKTASPLKHRHAVTPVRHPPKRRRLAAGVSSLAFGSNRLARSSDTDNSDQEGYLPKSQLMYASSPRALPRTRKALAKLRGKSGSRAGADSEMSPRKRKRSDRGSNSPVESDSWVETEDETPDFIAEGEFVVAASGEANLVDDQHFLNVATAHALQRLRKGELIRLWKVSGMWSSGEDDGMNASEEDGDHGLGKAELVSGIIGAVSVLLRHTGLFAHSISAQTVFGRWFLFQAQVILS